MRVKRGIARHRRHKKIRALAKGYRGMRKSTFVKANEAVIKAGQNSYIDRRKKKRDFVDALKKKKIELNRKVLSELAIHEPEVFGKIMKEVGVTK